MQSLWLFTKCVDSTQLRFVSTNIGDIRAEKLGRKIVSEKKKERKKEREQKEKVKEKT